MMTLKEAAGPKIVYFPEMGQHIEVTKWAFEGLISSPLGDT